MNQEFIDANMPRLDDFWRRRESAGSDRLMYHAYGHQVTVDANDALLLEAARISAGRYSRSPSPPESMAVSFHLMVDRKRPTAQPPVDLPSQLHYLSAGPWLTINGWPWLNASAHMEELVAVAAVSEALAQRPNLISRNILDTFTLNMLMRTGVGMVHASCLVHEGRALLLTGPHNAGKSASALRLALSGYRLMADGMTYVRCRQESIELLGYPVGEAKLRMDMLDEFPQLQGWGKAVMVREDTKMVFDLRQAMPESIVDEAIEPREIVICYVERRPGLTSRVEPLTRAEMLHHMWPESTFVDDWSVMQSNLAAIQMLLDKGYCHRLILGENADSFQAAVDDLMMAAGG